MTTAVSSRGGVQTSTCGRALNSLASTSYRPITLAERAALQALLDPQVVPVGWDTTNGQFVPTPGAFPLLHNLPNAPAINYDLSFALTTRIPDTGPLNSIPIEFEFFAPTPGLTLRIFIMHWDNAGGVASGTVLNPGGPMPTGFFRVRFDLITGLVTAGPSYAPYIAVAAGPPVPPTAMPNRDVYVVFDFVPAVPPNSRIRLDDLSIGFGYDLAGSPFYTPELGDKVTPVKVCPEFQVTSKIIDTITSPTADLLGSLYAATGGGATLSHLNLSTGASAADPGLPGGGSGAMTIDKSDRNSMYFITGVGAGSTLQRRNLTTNVDTVVGVITPAPAAPLWVALETDMQGNLYGVVNAAIPAVGNTFLINKQTAAVVSQQKLLGIGPLAATGGLGILGVPGQAGGRVFDVNPAGQFVREINWTLTTAAATSVINAAFLNTGAAGDVNGLTVSTDGRLFAANQLSGGRAGVNLYSNAPIVVAALAGVFAHGWRGGDPANIARTECQRITKFNCDGSVVCGADFSLTGAPYEVRGVLTVGEPGYYAEYYRLNSAALYLTATPEIPIHAANPSLQAHQVGQTATITGPYKAVAWRFLRGSANNSSVIVNSRIYQAGTGGVTTDAGGESDWVTEGDASLTHQLFFQAVAGALIEIKVERKV